MQRLMREHAFALRVGNESYWIEFCPSHPHVDADLSSTVLPDSISSAYGSRCAFVTSSPIDVSRTQHGLPESEGMPAKRSAVVPWPMTFGWRSGAIRELRQADQREGRAARWRGCGPVEGLPGTGCGNYQAPPKY